MQSYAEQIARIAPTGMTGTVVDTLGMTISAAGFPAPIGSLARIERAPQPPLSAEVIGFRGPQTLLAAYGRPEGIRHGARVGLTRTTNWLRVGDGLLGRVLGSQGEFLDRGPLVALRRRVPLEVEPPSPLDRPRIDRPLSTGIRSIDGLLTCGEGQRVGIFAGSGVGKSVTLGMMARYTSADVNVIGLIGERGREVNDFLERDLGAAGLARSVVVVATSDQPAILRVRAAAAATAIAEHFRDQGKRVLLMMDSLTRFAMAQREIGLAAGEPPTTRGYPPSVFAMLPRLVERSGRTERGSVTAIYTVLVDGDDLNEPVSDAVRGLLDGHVVLSRKLASAGHYPAVDLLRSVSRVMPDIVEKPQRLAATWVRRMLSQLEENEDLVSIGAYRPGGNPELDLALQQRGALEGYLRQDIDESSSYEQASTQLMQLATAAAQAQGAVPNENP